MHLKHVLSCLPEHAVFWLLLVSLSLGSAASLYKKITDRSERLEAAAEYYAAAPTVNSRAVISVKDYISSDLSVLSQGIYPDPSVFR